MPSDTTSSTLSTIELCYCDQGAAHKFHNDGIPTAPPVRVAEAMSQQPQPQAAGQPLQDMVPDHDPTDSKNAIIERIMPHLNDPSNIAIDPTFLDSTALGDLELGPQLGSGGCGVVYTVRAPDGTYYVLKRVKFAKWADGKYEAWGKLTPSKQRDHAEWILDISKDLILEGLLLQSLAPHPHIIECIDTIGGDGSKGAPFAGIIMPKMHGDAFKLFEKPSPISSHLVWRCFVQILSALEHIHDRGYIHSDVKPENFLLSVFDDFSKGEIVFKLADFGCAAHEDDVRPYQVGTIDYCAPEARKGRACCKSDVWSLMLTIVWALNAGDIRQWFEDDEIDMAREEDFNGMARHLKSIVTKDVRLRRFKDAVNKSPLLRPSVKQLRARMEGMSGWDSE